DVKITISDISGREIRTLEGTKRAGLNRVQWDLTPTPAGRGRGGRGAGEQPAAAAQPTGAQPQTTPPGQQAQGAQPGRGQEPAAAAQVQAPGRGGGGRGGFAPAVPAGSYLAKVMVGDKVIGQKTVVVEADSMQ